MARTLKEDLDTLGLDDQGHLKPEGGQPPKEVHPAARHIAETVIDDVRKIIEKNIQDIKNGLQALSLNKSEAQRALQLLKERLLGVKLTDVAIVAEEETTEAKGKVTGPKCDLCNKPAVVNYQKMWVRYPIHNGKYGVAEIQPEIEEPIGEENKHFCAEHAKSEGWA